ncbi:hypothetical protein [Nocardia carnea]|uniref:hypothetical protein n=1 Tax=Nocardia carnea TaxID=37328 RepID=UPI002455F4CE|nr:hypothetical protein [Nocardia carnea]
MSERNEVDEIGQESARVAQRVTGIIGAWRAKNPKAVRVPRSVRREINQALREERRREREAIKRLRTEVSSAIGVHREEVFQGQQVRVGEEMDTWFGRQQQLATQRHQLERFIQVVPGLSMTERGTAVKSLRSAHFRPATKPPAAFGPRAGVDALRARVEARLSRLRTGLVENSERARLAGWEAMRRARAEVREVADIMRGDNRFGPAAQTAGWVATEQQHERDDEQELLVFTAVETYPTAGSRTVTTTSHPTQEEAAQWLGEHLDTQVDAEETVKVSVDAEQPDREGFKAVPVLHRLGTREDTQAEVKRWQESLVESESGATANAAPVASETPRSVLDIPGLIGAEPRKITASIDYRDQYGKVSTKSTHDSAAAAAMWARTGLQRMHTDPQSAVSVEFFTNLGDGRGNVPLLGVRGEREEVQDRVASWGIGIAAEAEQDEVQRQNAELNARIEKLNEGVDKVLAQNKELREDLRAARQRVDELNSRVAGVATERDRLRGERDEAVQKLIRTTPENHRYGNSQRHRADSEGPRNGAAPKNETEQGSDWHLVEPEDEEEVPVIDLVEEEV